MRFTICSFVVLVGCGGAEFNGDLYTAPGTGGSPEADAAGTGGVVSTGGATAVETGGHPTETGGSSSTGGAVQATGGVTASTGGAVATGGATSTGGITASTGGATTCTLVTHDNGIGQTWQDCVPLDTYNLEQAMKACTASGAGTCMVSNGCGGINFAVRAYSVSGQLTASWGYQGVETGFVDPTGGSDPCSSGPYPRWN